MLNAADIAALVRPGRADRVVARIFAAQIEKRMLILARVRRALGNDAPELTLGTGFDAAYELLLRLPPRVVHDVFADSSFGAFCGASLRLLKMGAHRRFPEAEPSLLYARLGNYAVAAAMLSDVDARARCVVNVRGMLVLPGTGRVVHCPMDLAGKRVDCFLSNGVIEIVADDTRARIAVTEQRPRRVSSSFEVEALPRVGTLRIDDTDDLLWRDTDDQRPAMLDRDAQITWRDGMTRALDLLARIDPEQAREVLAGVRVVVPLDGGSKNSSLSSTSRDGTGAIRVSHNPSDAVQAEVLCHEYHHSKLYALLDLVPLLTERGQRAVAYSPWKGAMRPFHGLIHGAYAFLAVARFWSAAGRTGRATEESVRRAGEVRTVLSSVLAESEMLTEEGAVFVGELSAALAELGTSGSAAPQRRLVVERSPWLERWRVAGGSFRAPAPELAMLAPSDPQEHRLCEELGSPGGLLVNRRDDRLLRADRTLDELGRGRVLDPERHAELTRRIQALPGSSAVACRLRGHGAYVDGDFTAAAGHYASVLTVVPYDIDAWRDFAFALRRLGLGHESDAWTFGLEPAVALASQIRIDRPPLENLLGGEVRAPKVLEASPAAAAHALFLRWRAA